MHICDTYAYAHMHISMHILKAASILNITFIFYGNGSHDSYTVVRECCTKMSRWQYYNEYCTCNCCNKVKILRFNTCCSKVKNVTMYVTT